MDFIAEVIVVDDGSTDETIKIVKSFRDDRIRLFSQPRNLGKGAAVRIGLAAASSAFVAIQDADLEYDPADLELLLGPLRDGRADVVFGSRFRSGTEHRVLFFWHSLGNKFLTTMSNITTNLNLTDMETGYKVFRREVLSSFVLEENGFGMEPEITAKVAALKLRIFEVGISYSGRTYSEGKKIGWRDGFKALYAIGKYASSARADKRNENLAESLENADINLIPTLDNLSDSIQYNQWIVDLLAPHLGQNVLEIGAGQGSITRMLAAAGRRVTALEPSRAQYEILERNLADLDSVLTLNGGFESVERMHEFDSVVLVNVLEHIRDDAKFLRDINDGCRPGTMVLIWVPAFQSLYSEFDRSIGHFRRYSRSRLTAVAQSAGLEILSVEYANSLGTFAWLAGVKILKFTPSNSFATKIYDSRVVPTLRRMESGRRVPFGQSLLLVAVSTPQKTRIDSDNR
jgi:2-polyprenyl-3-methyl-5-hydroxy-6-metoxy-1,4-benzoquinol methylase